MEFKLGLDNALSNVPTGKIGLITNATAVGRNCTQNVDMFLKRGAEIKKIFSPEHGFYATFRNGEMATDDTYRGIPVVSLYTAEKRDLQSNDLDDLDVLVFDLQDVGSRPYTYLSTLYNVIKNAATIGFTLVILDRPNPLGINKVAGPMMHDDYISFVGTDLFPLRYGMTIGELGSYMNRKYSADVTISKMNGYSRNLKIGRSYNPLVPPSLNLPTMDSLINFNGFVLLESAKISVGRGTPYPFGLLGFPGAWKFQSAGLSGTYMRRVIFSPYLDPLKDQRIEGFFVHIMDYHKHDAIRLSMQMLKHIYTAQPELIDHRHLQILYGSNKYLRFLEGDISYTELEYDWATDSLDFMEERRRHMLYP